MSTMIARSQDCLVAFPSSLGWMAIIGVGSTLKGLTFGHPSGPAAIHALTSSCLEEIPLGQWNDALVGRLQAFASGTPDDFRDVEVEIGSLSPFHRRVVEICRNIPIGHTISYGQLAARAGSPQAARAVGNCMARNRVPLIVPCHRVVGSDGRLHGFSAVDGLSMKRRLLDLEAGMLAR